MVNGNFDFKIPAEQLLNSILGQFQNDVSIKTLAKDRVTKHFCYYGINEKRYEEMKVQEEIICEQLELFGEWLVKKFREENPLMEK